MLWVSNLSFTFILYVLPNRESLQISYVCGICNVCSLILFTRTPQSRGSPSTNGGGLYTPASVPCQRTFSAHDCSSHSTDLGRSTPASLTCTRTVKPVNGNKTLCACTHTHVHTHTEMHVGLCVYTHCGKSCCTSFVWLTN